MKLQTCSLGESRKNSASQGRRDRTRERLGERGAILLEFGLIFPFLFLLLVGSVEFSRSLRIREMMSILSREAAYQAFRQCASEVSPRVCTGTISTTDACLTRIHLELGGLAQAILGGNVPYGLSMSVYSYDASKDTVLWLGISHDINGTAHHTELTDTIVRNKYLPLLQQHRVIAVSEVSYRFSPFFNVSWLSPSPYYESTIY